MAWSETMFIIQHFYNVFEIDERLTKLENRIPLIARSIDGKPEGIEIEDLIPGTLWFIVDNSDQSIIKSLTIFTEDRTFAEPIPFGGSGGGSSDKIFDVELNSAEKDSYTLLIVNKEFELELNEDDNYTLVIL